MVHQLERRHRCGCDSPSDVLLPPSHDLVGARCEYLVEGIEQKYGTRARGSVHERCRHMVPWPFGVGSPSADSPTRRMGDRPLIS
jgi:hypothetical protein